MQKKAVIATTCIIFLILLLSLISIFHMEFSTADDLIAEIYQNGILVETIDLNNVTESYEITLDGTDDSYNTIYVEHGRISMKDASCPDHLCVHMGTISNSALPITCLPNKIIIKINSKYSNDDFDAVAQ